MDNNTNRIVKALKLSAIVAGYQNGKSQEYEQEEQRRRLQDAAETIGLLAALARPDGGTYADSLDAIRRDIEDMKKAL